MPEQEQITDTNIEQELSQDLDILTSPVLPVRRITTTSTPDGDIVTLGRYYMEEDELPAELRSLLHGRAFVVDRDVITETSSGSPRTYYIAADTVQGLIVPARSVSIHNYGPGDSYYRWTDDGERWTGWITLEDDVIHTYTPEEHCRFAEVQVYVQTSGCVLSLRATR